jgi:hypothetical protein
MFFFFYTLRDVYFSFTTADTSTWECRLVGWFSWYLRVNNWLGVQQCWGKKNVLILYIIMDGWLIMPRSIYRQIENMELYMQHYTKNYPSALPNRCNIISPSGLAFRQLKHLVQFALYDVVFVCHTPVVATTVHSRWRLVHPVIVDNLTTKHCRAGFSLPEIGCWITPEVSAVSGDAAWERILGSCSPGAISEAIAGGCEERVKPE